jgi:glycosyltransferase involved in cell wall biosynthesis
VATSVSVVIPTYNYGRFIAEAIQGALKQSHPASEIIVIDDGSTDDTESAVKPFGEKVRYIRQQNSGVCAARNRGVAESSGEYIAFLDADDIWESTKVEKQLRRFAEDPEIGLVHCGMREFDSESGQTIKLHLDGQEGWVANELLLWERPAVNVSGTAVMVSRTAFEAAGGFDTRQKVAEDWDFCYRVAKRFKVGFVRELLVNYRSHRAAAHRNVLEMERGMGLFYEKAFANGDDILRLKNRALGNFHRIMAGSYFQSGNYGSFVRHAVKSVARRPGGIKYFFGFPLRRIRRQRAGGAQGPGIRDQQ